MTGTYTTNNSFYKPLAGEVGWAALVDANFDDIDSRLHPLNAAIMYAHPSGSNSNDGLSWATAKKDILGAYDALSSSGGEIRFADGTYVDATNTDRGLWLAGAGDPNYGSLPTGWRQAKPLKLIGHGGLDFTTGMAEPAALLRGGSGSDRNKPTIWLSSTSKPIGVENAMIKYPAVGMKLGINSNGTITDSVAGVRFRNVGVNLNSVAGNGPGVEFGYVFWVYFEKCGFNGCAASYSVTASSITAGTTARFTIGTNYLKAGDTVRVYGMTPAGYNGTWTVTAVAATTFDADIGTSPGAGTVFGSAQPVRSYRRAALAMDQLEQFTFFANAGLIELRDCVLSGGHFHYAPGNGTFGNVRMENCTYEGDFTSTQPPILHVRAAVGGNLPRAGTNIVMTGIEMADGVFPDGPVRVDGPDAPHDLVTLTGGGSQIPVGNMTAMSSRTPRTAAGWRGRYTETGGRPFQPLILGQHDAARRSFGPAAVRFTNRAATDVTTWSGKSGGATVTTGVTAPDGTTNAASLTKAGSNDNRQPARFTVTPAVGDWLIGGVWRRFISGSSSDVNMPSLSWSSGTTFERSGSGEIVMHGPRFDDGGWEWCSGGSRLSAVSGGAVDGILALNVADGSVIAYYAPVCFYVPAASVVDDDEMYDLVRHLAPVSDTASAGQVSMLRGQSLHIPNGYIELAEMTAPSAPTGASTRGRLYMDVSGGKQRLMMLFDSGVAQVVATEP